MLGQLVGHPLGFEANPLGSEAQLYMAPAVDLGAELTKEQALF